MHRLDKWAPEEVSTVRMLVTGCAGFIGSNLSEHLIASGHDVIGLDCFTDYYSRSIKESNLTKLLTEPRFSFHETDLAVAELEPLIEGVEVVYHEAAQPGVRASWGREFDAYVRANIVVTQRLLETVKERPLKKFVYASSSSVYGDAESFPTRETLVPRPVSPYGVTKLAGEHLVHLYWRNYGVPALSLRYFTVYGPRQRPDMAFHRFIRSILEDKPIEVFGDGHQTRDFTYVGDVSAANLAAADTSAEGVVLNIGGGSRVSVNRVIELLGALLGRTPRVDYRGAQRGDVRHTSADTHLAADLLGYAPQIDLAEGLAREAEWFKAQFDVSRSAGHEYGSV